MQIIYGRSVADYKPSLGVGSGRSHVKKLANPALRNKSEQVADALMSRIIDGGLKPGDMLGTEAELLAGHDVSRPTLRESLRMLEAQGVIALRPGPGGGAIVGRPSVDTLAHALSVFLYLQSVPFGMVLKAREAIEPALAAEAATHGTEAEFDELAASIERMREIREQEAFVQENRTFHEIIARASRNKVLESFWAAISLLAGGEQHGISYSFGNRMHVAEAHAEILAACRQRKPEIAAARMAAHVAELEHLVRRRYQSALAEPTRMMVRAGN
jgi:GntR family transcriptional regulator, transcriptional repressor for pyruvate dehydrogenase complex